MSPGSSYVTTNVLHRKLHDEPDKVVSTAGLSLRLDNGKSILDGTAGSSVSILPDRLYRIEVSEAITKQIVDLPYIYAGAHLTSNSAEALASFLLHDQPGGLSKALFFNSGSEATDAAIKVATQYWHERQQPNKRYFVARKQSFHGNTLGALAVSGHSQRRAIYNDMLSSGVVFVDSCYSYRLQCPGETDEQYVERLANQLEEEILRLGPENVSAFLAETVSGITLGCVPAIPGYFKSVRRLCDKYDVLLILDEVMCGIGKTGTMHAWEQEGISGPDIQTVGKALGAGYIPLSGVLLHRKICNVLEHGTGNVLHSHTFQAHPTACAAALVVQKIIRRDRLLDNVASQGRRLEYLLRSEIESLPYVGNVRGRGLFWSVEFMLDPHSKTPFAPDVFLSRRIVARARELGLSVLGSWTTADDEVHVEHVTICPAYTVKEQDLRRMIDILRRAIADITDSMEMPN